MSKVFTAFFAACSFFLCVLSAAEAPGAGEIAQCVKTAKIVFSHKDDRDARGLDKYYEPKFRALIKKGVASESGELPFLDADFLRLTQDVFHKISKVGPGTFRNARISVPVVLQYGPDESNTNTAVFERAGDDRWMIADLVSGSGSLRANLEKEFGTRR